MYIEPILFLVFNRPEETAKSFEMIRKIKPQKLFVAADGPRLNNASDLVNCKKVREMISKGIDWDCEIKTLFREENLGCGKAVQGALDWFFSEVEMGIIIEDDIIPTHSFFEYASILLNRYKDNSEIFSINGCSLAYENLNFHYGLTRYFNMWGWATWRRSNELVHKTWPIYDTKIDFKKNSTLIKALHLPIFLPQHKWLNRWKFLLENTKNGNINTWDFQWAYSSLRNKKFCIRPNINMINNIGFNENGTHTSQSPHIKLDNMVYKNFPFTKSTLKGVMRLDKRYEIENVAEYWNHVKLNYIFFIKLLPKSLLFHYKLLLNKYIK